MPRSVTCEGCGEPSRVRPQDVQTPRCRRCHRSLPWLVDASDDDFTSVTDSAPLPVVVDLWGPWCAPSRRLASVFEQLARVLAGRAKLVRVNVEDTPKLVQRFEVRGLPTLLVMHRGRALARKSGATHAQEIRDWVEEALRCAENVTASASRGCATGERADHHDLDRDREADDEAGVVELAVAEVHGSGDRAGSEEHEDGGADELRGQPPEK